MANYKGKRSLNGRLGYIRKNSKGGYDYVTAKGKTIWSDLRKWELNLAKPYKPRKKK